MAKKSFLLVSLNESKAKKLAEVISNKTCITILDYMAEKKDATETELAKALNIPLSTVHYNMKSLVDARLVKSDEYHYSEKGKEVSHYKLANQYVIIAPEGEKAAIKEKLKSIIPTALIMGAAASIIKLFSGSFGFAQSTAAPLMMKASAPMAEQSIESVAPMIADEAAGAAQPLLAEAAPRLAAKAAPMIAEESTRMVADNAAEAVPAVQQAVAEQMPEAYTAAQQATSHAPEIALWFFIGAVSSVAVYLIIDYIIKKVRERRDS